MDTTTLTLPKALVDTYAEIARRDGRTLANVVRTALEIYAERAGADVGARGVDGDESPRRAVGDTVAGAMDDPRPWAHRRAEYYASIGIDASTLPDWIGMDESGPDDGYDSSNIRDWIRATWKPE